MLSRSLTRARVGARKLPIRSLSSAVDTAKEVAKVKRCVHARRLNNFLFQPVVQVLSKNAAKVDEAGTWPTEKELATELTCCVQSSATCVSAAGLACAEEARRPRTVCQDIY